MENKLRWVVGAEAGTQQGGEKWGAGEQRYRLGYEEERGLALEGSADSHFQIPAIRPSEELGDGGSPEIFPHKVA